MEENKDSDIKDYLTTASDGKKYNMIDYSSFLPEKISKQWIISSPKINALLSEANRLLGELNAFSQLIPDVDFFIKSFVKKHA